MVIPENFIAFILMGIFWAFVSWTSPKNQLVFYSVGNGDSVLLRSEGETILIDGGLDSNLIFKLLWDIPFCSLDSILLTHPHKDHYLGFFRVFSICTPSRVFQSKIPYDNTTYLKWVDLSSTVENVSLYRGDYFEFGGGIIYVLWPPKDFDDPNVNNMSTVLLFDKNDFEVLFMGDLEKDFHDFLDLSSYTYLIDDGLDVYKVPHHGSIDSLNKGIFDIISPDIAIVSTGENSYGHPSLFVLHFLESQGIHVLRTDALGDIRLGF